LRKKIKKIFDEKPGKMGATRIIKKKRAPINKNVR